MNEVYEDPLAKLEAVLLDWDSAFCESRQRVTSRLQAAKARLELAWSRAEGAQAAVDAASVAAGTHASIPELEADCTRLAAGLDDARERIPALEQSLERAYARIQELERNHTELLLATDVLKKAKAALAADKKTLQDTVAGLEGELETVSEELAEARRERAPVPDRAATGADVDPLFQGLAVPDIDHVRRELDLERQRFQARVAHIEKENDYAHTNLARRLAEALRDRDEAHQSIVQLRAEVETMRARGVGAGLAAEDNRGGLKTLDLDKMSITRLRLGQMLQRSGILSDDQLEQALAVKKKTPQKPLGAILVEMGLTDEETIGKVLASQLNLPYIELDQRAIDPAAAALIPGKLARHHVCIPLSVERGQLQVAMANPLDLVALEDLELATRRRVDPVIATPAAIGNAIAQYYTSI